MQWLIRWSAMVISRYKVGPDGKTAYERRRGRRCMVPLAAIGEKVWFRKLEKNKNRNKFDIKWDEGIWLGHTRNSNEAFIGTPEGTVKAYACKRRPDDEKWDMKAIDAIKGTPYVPIPKGLQTNVPIRVQLPEPEGPPGAAEPSAQRVFQPRRVAITQKELDKYGYSVGCPGCDSKRQGGVAKVGHNENCRRMI